MKLNKQSLIFLLLVIAITTIVKVICAPQINLSGFSAVFAVALFAGLTEKDSQKAFLLPLITLFFSDVLLQVFYLTNLFPFAGFYQGQWLNYLLIVALTLVGIVFRKARIGGMIAATLIGPAMFFLASNYIVWTTNGGLGYTKDFNGLMECYRAGLPFYRNSMISTIIFLPSFIFLYHRIVRSSLPAVSTK
jgi:hypothetical protein